MAKAKRKISHIEHLKVFLLGVIAAMVVVLISMMIIRYEEKQRASNEIHVSLGSMQYDFSNGKAVKRTDETISNLRNFLIEKAEESASENCTPYYNVVLASEDEKQVRLQYGCGYPSAHMFAVNEGGAWRTISPTNQFDMIGTPLCDHVNGNGIEKTLAPVCYSLNDTGDAQVFSVR